MTAFDFWPREYAADTRLSSVPAATLAQLNFLKNADLLAADLGMVESLARKASPAQQSTCGAQPVEPPVAATQWFVNALSAFRHANGNRERTSHRSRILSCGQAGLFHPRFRTVWEQADTLTITKPT